MEEEEVVVVSEKDTQGRRVKGIREGRGDAGEAEGKNGKRRRGVGGIGFKTGTRSWKEE